MSEGAPHTDKIQQRFVFCFGFFFTPIMEVFEAVLTGYPHGVQVVDACLA